MNLKAAQAHFPGKYLTKNVCFFTYIYITVVLNDKIINVFIKRLKTMRTLSRC